MSARSSILLFSETDYAFSSGLPAETDFLRVDEPSALVEEVKRNNYAIIIFDTGHIRFSESLVMRIYRRTPLSEFWMLTSGEQSTLPEYMVDAVLSCTTGKTEFVTRVKSCLDIRSRLEKYHMVGKSESLKRVVEMIGQVGPTDISTLIIGPSGSGKELVARAIHDSSRRKGKAYIAVNCGALAEGLLESELFGHERGAFTGAVGKREGIFKRADGGTVFLDEVGETTPALQVKLLRVLEDGTYYRVGGNEQLHSDIRVIAATNRELTDDIGEHRFREDLYFRLGAVRMNLEGLAARKSDIIPLLHHFFIQETGSRRGISQRAMDLLVNYGWPGNVRQLRNFVSRMIVAATEGEISENLVRQFIEEQGYSERTLPVVTGKTTQQAEFQLIYQALLSLGQEVRMLRDIILDNIEGKHDAVHPQTVHDNSPGDTLEDMEEELIRQTLAATEGNRREAARKLGIGERTLYRKLNKYDID